VDSLRKVVESAAEPWLDTPDGRLKWLANGKMDVRLFGIDVFLQELAATGPSVKHWHMADELFYVLEGAGHTDEWQVEADIDDRYYARVALEPRRHAWKQGDLVYVPQNTVHQHVADAEGALLLGAQNRIFKLLGYDAIRRLESS
jgi:quercetin dioxygenase-like cupin family protein